MLSNIEQAIVNVLACKQVPDYNNVFRAYDSISRLPNEIRSIEGANYFNRAIGKYPASGERSQALFADHVTSIHKHLLQTRVDFLAHHMPLAKRFPCPCNCGELFTKDVILGKLGLLGETEDRLVAPIVKYPKSKSRRISHREIRPKKRARISMALDPYGPSTSTSSM